MKLTNLTLALTLLLLATCDGATIAERPIGDGTVEARAEHAASSSTEPMPSAEAEEPRTPPHRPTRCGVRYTMESDGRCHLQGTVRTRPMQSVAPSCSRPREREQDGRCLRCFTFNRGPAAGHEVCVEWGSSCPKWYVYKDGMCYGPCRTRFRANVSRGVCVQRRAMNPLCERGEVLVRRTCYHREDAPSRFF